MICLYCWVRGDLCDVRAVDEPTPWMVTPLGLGEKAEAVDSRRERRGSFMVSLGGAAVCSVQRGGRRTRTLIICNSGALAIRATKIWVCLFIK